MTNWLQLGRSIGGILVIITFASATIGDAFISGVEFDPWLIVVMLALIYGLLGLDHFVLNHFPVQITITTDSEQDDFEDD